MYSSPSRRTGRLQQRVVALAGGQKRLRFLQLRVDRRVIQRGQRLLRGRNLRGKLGVFFRADVRCVVRAAVQIQLSRVLVEDHPLSRLGKPQQLQLFFIIGGEDQTAPFGNLHGARRCVQRKDIPASVHDGGRRALLQREGGLFRRVEHQQHLAVVRDAL